MNKMWAISLIIIGLATLSLSVARHLDIELSDTVKRTICIIELIALPVLAYSTVKKIKTKGK